MGVIKQTLIPTKSLTKKEVIEEMLKKLLQKNNPSFAAVPAVPQPRHSMFSVLEAVPTRPTSAPVRPTSPTIRPRTGPTAFPVKNLLMPTSAPAQTLPPPPPAHPMVAQPLFSPVPAVPGSRPQAQGQLARAPKKLAEFAMSLSPGLQFTTSRPVTQFPTFRHFPAAVGRHQLLTPRSSGRLSNPSPALSFTDQQKAAVLDRLQSVIRSTQRPTTPSTFPGGLFTTTRTRRPAQLPASVNFVGGPVVASGLVTRPPAIIGGGGQVEPALRSLRQSLLAAVTAGPGHGGHGGHLGHGGLGGIRGLGGLGGLSGAVHARATTQRPPSLPRGTTRGEIMALLARTASTTPLPPPSTSTPPPTTPQPQVQSTTNRAEVLRLLQQLLGSVKPSSPSTTTQQPTTTTRLATTGSSVTAKFGSFQRAPSLRFDSPPQLEVEVAPMELPYGMTTATPIHPTSPFPRMEPPQHDLLASHLLLADPMDGVTPASSIHPTSPFPNLQAPNFRPDFQTEFTGGRALPRLDVLPPDPARRGPTPPPGPLKLRLDTDFLESQLLRSGRHHKEHRQARWHTPRPSLEAPPPLHPVPRTRLIAPRSQQPAMNRRLSIDGPTEASLSPLEQLAMGTVPRYQPDSSFFGTPRSRQLEGQTPLERLAGGLRGAGDGWGEDGPVTRTRHQRMPGKERGSYQHLAGVQTGTTALGLVEHRGNQPFFHVPVFTTPIPKNGKFITTNENRLRGFAASLRNITSTLGRKLPRLPDPAAGLARLKEAMAGAAKVRARALAPAPRPLAAHGRGHAGRKLDTFSRYTKMGNFRSGGEARRAAGWPLLLTLAILWSWL